MMLQDFKIPILRQEDAEHLGEPITLTDLKNTIAGMKKVKLPGWDGSLWGVMSHFGRN